MEWLVPILFVVLSLAQWWLKHRQASTPNVERPVESPEPLDEFGDLMEALGRRRHESPPTSPVPPKSLPPQILPLFRKSLKHLCLFWLFSLPPCRPDLSLRLVRWRLGLDLLPALLLNLQICEGQLYSLKFSHRPSLYAELPTWLATHPFLSL